MSLVVPGNSLLGRRLQDIDPSILNVTKARAQQIRPLHIGFINLMPDAVLERTEDQFLLPLHFASAALQIEVDRIALPGVERGATAQAYIDREYRGFREVLDKGLDGLIITGANISDPDLTKAGFWKPLTAVFDAAEEHVTSTLLSCLSTHAYMLHKHVVARQPVTDSNGDRKKQWGVYAHQPSNRNHPLLRGLGNTVDVIHSRWNDISEANFTAAGMKVLLKSHEAGVHMAVSHDGLRTVCLQGHPEYEDISLLKEFSRDARLYHERKLAAKPPLPEHYLHGSALQLAEHFRKHLEPGEAYPPYPEQMIASTIVNRWEAGRTVMFANWIRAVYEITGYDRKEPFMRGVDPDHIFNGDHSAAPEHS